MYLRLIVCLFLSCHTSLAAILSIDYGTEWTKAALVKPGIPLEIVLTKDTKRKEQSVIAFKGDERLYGGDAANLASRFPHYTYPALKTLLGQAYNSEAARRYSTLYPAVKLVKGEHNSIAFEHGAQSFTVEELVAMELINMRKNAELMADGNVRDTVLTVSPHFDHDQRSALIAAAKLAGLQPIELLNDGLAVAMDYAKSRTFNESQVHAIFDMGAGSTSATIVKFASKSVKDVGRYNKTVTSIEILGTASTVDVSGNVMSERLYKYLMETFTAARDATTKTSFSTNYRAHARLLKEATRIKQILSANNEAIASVESLHEDIDFKHKITRTTFEELCSDLPQLTADIVQTALLQAQLKIADVQSVILHGGAARVPFVQSALLSVAAENQLARNVNADEAAVMGAVFRGAGLSGSFRVKELDIKDFSTSAFTYTVDGKSIPLLSVSSAYGTQKNLTFEQKKSDIDIVLYASNGAVENEVARYQIKGVSDATAELLKSHGCSSPEVVVTTDLDYSGLLSVSRAMALCQVEDRPGVADKLKGWFGSKDSAETSEQSEKQVNETVAEPSTPKSSVKVVSLTVKSTAGPFTPDLGSQEQSLGKIASFEKIDTDRIARETARNGLEAYIYKLRDYLENESFSEFSTATERKELQSLSASATEWMYEQGDSSTQSDLIAKRKSMSDISDKILFRRSEAQTRQSKIDGLQKQISTSRTFVKSQLKQISEYESKKAELEKKAKEAAASEKPDVKDDLDATEDASNENSTAPAESEEFEIPAPLYSESELSVLMGKLDHVEEWLSERSGEQDKLAITADPVLLTSELDRRTSKITDDFMYLLRKVSYADQSKTKAKAKSKVKSKSKSKTAAPTKKTQAKAEEAKGSDEVLSDGTTKSEDAEAPAEGEAAKPDTNEDLADNQPESKPAEPQPEASADSDATPHDEL